MFAVAVAVFMGGYWLFHWGYYYSHGCPISLLDDILPSRRPVFLAAVDYARGAGPFAGAGGSPCATLTAPGGSTSSTPSGTVGTSQSTAQGAAQQAAQQANPSGAQHAQRPA